MKLLRQIFYLCKFVMLGSIEKKKITRKTNEKLAPCKTINKTFKTPKITWIFSLIAEMKS